jgi:hypothetical protein
MSRGKPLIFKMQISPLTFLSIAIEFCVEIKNNIMKTSFIKRISAILIATSILASCSKSSNSSTTETPATIYVGGYTYESANFGEVIWKNGVEQKVFDSTLMPSSGYVRYPGAIYDLDIENDKVYAAWKLSYKALSAYYPTAKTYLWKNSSNTLLIDNDYNVNPKAIDVSGTDIYFGGFYTNTYEYPSIWKNNVRTQLPGGTGTVNDLYVNNLDIFAVGSLSANTTAAYWKNGVLTSLATGNGYSANGIAYFNNDIFVAGEGKLGGVNDNRSALIWVNGVQQKLTTPSSQQGAAANSIALSSTKICVAGYAYSGSDQRATVWINGTPTLLSTSESMAYAVAIKDNTVYVVGYEKPNNYYRAKLWKITATNTESINLSNGTADAKAYSIKVK